MSRTSSRRLSAAFVLITLLGLSLPVSAQGPESKHAGVLSWVQEWIDSVWSVLVPAGPGHPAAPPIGAIGMDGVSNPDRGALIDPNGGPGW